ncbi:hypothetical protein Tco_1213488 [Tanacetum coccineum]
MDPNSSLGKICLGEDVVVISSDKVEGSGDWNSLEFQDTATSGQKKAMVFYQMDTEEVNDRFVAPCFVNGLEAYEQLLIYEELRGRHSISPILKSILGSTPKRRMYTINTSKDDWDHLLDFNIDDIPLLGEEGLPPFVCKMGKSSRNKKRVTKNLDFFYQDMGTSSSTSGHLTQEEAAKEAIAIRMS